MCGRYVIATPPAVLRAHFGYAEQPNFPPRYNVAPAQPAPVVRLHEGQRQFVLMRWGLIPSWIKDPRQFSLLINARGESAAEKPAFRAAMRWRRCLIPADGFYEWKQQGERKRPFFIRRKDSQPMAFAGLWETWTGPDGEEIDTAAIVTVAANRTLAPVHDRMPAILAPEAYDLWLDVTKADEKIATALLAPAPENLLEVFEISTAVNRTANDFPKLIEPLAVAGAEPESLAEPKPAAPKRARKPRKNDGGQGALF